MAEARALTITIDFLYSVTAKGQKLILMKHSYDLAQLAQLLQCATDEAKVMGVRAVIGSRVIMTTKCFYKC